jgi:hypothetical protein
LVTKTAILQYEHFCVWKGKATPRKRKFMGHVGVRLCSKKSSWAMLGSFSKMEKFMDDNCNSQYKAFFGK